jgi:hypothetical protein
VVEYQGKQEEITDASCLGQPAGHNKANQFQNSLSPLWTRDFKCSPHSNVRQDRSVGIATRYGLQGPGIESLWGRDFPHSPSQSWGPPSLLYNGYRVSLPGPKRPGRDVNHSPLSSTEIKERVELHFYFPSGPWWPVLGWSLPLPVFRLFRIAPRAQYGPLWLHEFKNLLMPKLYAFYEYSRSLI